MAQLNYVRQLQHMVTASDCSPRSCSTTIKDVLCSAVAGLIIRYNMAQEIEEGEAGVRLNLVRGYGCLKARP